MAHKILFFDSLRYSSFPPKVILIATSEDERIARILDNTRGHDPTSLIRSEFYASLFAIGNKLRDGAQAVEPCQEETGEESHGHRTPWWA